MKPQDSWAWKYFRSSKEFFHQFYYGDPNDVHHDPRPVPADQPSVPMELAEEEPGLLQDQPALDPRQVRAIRQYDLTSLTMNRNE
jgi:hypothetical protein